ncbi:hypothetical protein COCSUDRAFT_32231 [Coccomyxa subellipsoidea C-169]|uniref:Uncharacterized protein n=1 Tax=Coccomyxa subellipsoidea (strain C-169) TaxID=574566 RepID=I0Z7K5_COCSC|nr:hypothetical protein COCSUDRAFT_32231 [Coccomyxa subellipsoidea C-169]EIE26624.1 hypothetical protein COCSUDRAFT_32231 [Coccomyxa subellipsoidea C-169]|eukprot:XP_005651168.1 hypothetical protein COCSUDRAFT_32231 [Coccomyxa subellipsoidea C-169]
MKWSYLTTEYTEPCTGATVLVEGGAAAGQHAFLPAAAQQVLVQLDEDLPSSARSTAQ